MSGGGGGEETARQSVGFASQELACFTPIPAEKVEYDRQWERDEIQEGIRVTVQVDWPAFRELAAREVYRRDFVKQREGNR